MSAPILIKKYSNRRLYDTGASCYITQEALSRKIRDGAEVRIVEAKSGKDITQATLTQIVIEGRGAARMLPVPLLIKLIRLDDDALAEFFGHYLFEALTFYLQTRPGSHGGAGYHPFAGMPFAVTEALARMVLNASTGGASRAAERSPVWGPARDWESAPDEREPVAKSERFAQSHARMPLPAARDDEVAALRRELEDLKRSLQRPDATDEPAPSGTRRPRRRRPR